MLTTAVPVTAGNHTIDLMLAASDFRYRLPNISVVLSASGSASPRGTDGVG